MFPATVVCAGLLGAVLLASSVALVRRDRQTIDMLEVVGATAIAPLLTAIGLGGAAGLLVGLAVSPVGVVSAAAVIAYMGGAVAAHLRAGDTAVGRAVVVGLLAAVYLVLRLMTA